MKRLKVIALLLDYPQAALWQHQQELLEACSDAPVLQAFIRDLCASAQLDAEARWVAQFERGRATSLLLFEHVHGESRDRGQAMVDLLEQYRAAGLELDSRELPDFLPLYLEYLSSREPETAREGLVDIAPILALLSARLHQRNSRWAGLLDLLLAISESGIAAEALEPQVTQEARDDTPQALDAVWEEEQIRFLGEQGCASAQQEAHQRRFAGAVAPQYLDVAQATTGMTGR